ncbi:MAG: hypothetical protein AAF490_17090 [Chloroflexota bacterium]
MTPTLSGRWQSRLLLLGSLGALISFGFALIFNSVIPLILLAVVIFLGLIWDIFYDKIQQRRWDHDWPPAFQLLAGVFEGLFIFGLLQIVPLPGIPNAFQFWAHYTAVWVVTFLASQSVMRLFFPRWRFNGGVWL